MALKLRTRGLSKARKILKKHMGEEFRYRMAKAYTTTGLLEQGIPKNRHSQERKQMRSKIIRKAARIRTMGKVLKSDKPFPEIIRFLSRKK